MNTAPLHFLREGYRRPIANIRLHEWRILTYIVIGRSLMTAYHARQAAPKASTARSTNQPAAGPQNLADLHALIAARQDLKPALRQNLLSALRTFERVVRRTLATIPATCSDVRVAIDRARPGAADVSPSRWNNVRSLLQVGLRIAGILPPSLLQAYPIDPAWQDWLARLPERDRWSLTQLARYCSRQGITIDRVDDAVIKAFHRALMEWGLSRNPDTVRLNTIKVWNKTRALDPSWPGTDLTTDASRRRNPSLPWSAFPPTLELEVENYLAWCQTNTLLGTNAPDSPVCSSTVRHRRHLLRQFASTAVKAGAPAASLVHLSDLLELELVRKTLSLLHRPANPTEALHHLAIIIASIGRKYLCLHPDVVKELARIAKELNPRIGGFRPRTRDILDQFDDPAVLRRLLDLPYVLYRKAKLARNSRKAALAHQTGLIIQLLLHVPLRRRSLQALKVEGNLRLPPANTDREGEIRLSPEETKNRRSYTAPLPAELCDEIRKYVDKYRPVLLRQDCPWLFPGRAAAPKCAGMLHVQVARAVWQHLGLKMTVHAFRALAGKLASENCPDGLAQVQQLLGHAQLDTTKEFYAGFQSKTALRSYHQVLRTERSGNPRATKVGNARTKSRSR